MLRLIYEAQAARQSLVLLKNPALATTGRPVLPLAKTMKVALIGPHATTQKDLAGNYFEDIGVGTCAGPQCITSVADAIGNVTGAANLAVVQGCSDMKCTNVSTANFSAAVAAAKGADAVVLAMGISGDIEGEGHDRMDIRMPGMQYNLTKAIIDAVPGVPVVLLLFNGGMVTIEDLKLEDIAVVECWYPGMTGGTSIADSLFGTSNRWGKLPFTYCEDLHAPTFASSPASSSSPPRWRWHHFLDLHPPPPPTINTSATVGLTRSRFPRSPPADAYNYTVASDFDDMNMTSGPGNPGRSYKYLDDESLALWPYGFGLSYTTFSLTKGGDTETDAAAALTIARPADEAVTSIVVKNTGDVVGDEVFLAWA